MTNFNDDKIDEYLFGILTANETAVFEQQIQTNADLAAEIKQRRDIMKHIEFLEDQEMMTRVRRIHQQEQSKSGKIIPFKRFRWVAAAALVILSLGAGWWLWNSNSAQQSGDLYAAYYAPYDLRFGDRSDAEDVLNKAGGFYLDGNYQKAAPLLQNIVANNPTESKAVFALGIAHMELKNWDAAISSFQQLIKTNDFLYADKAKWYLALTYYQLDRLDESKALLKELTNKKNADFSTKAGVFLNQLK